MKALFSSHPGSHGRGRHAGADEPSAMPERGTPPASVLAPAGSGGEPEAGGPAPLAAPVPEAPAQEAPEIAPEQVPCAPEAGLEPPLPRRVPDLDHHRERLSRMLDAPQRPGLDEMRQVIKALKGWDPHAPEAIAACVAATTAQPVTEEPAQPARVTPERHREPGVPAGLPVLLGVGGAGRPAAAALDGMPERKTLQGQPVIHLGYDPRRPDEAFALGMATDAYLDALIDVLIEERGVRRAAAPTGPRPVFTPHGQDGVDL